MSSAQYLNVELNAGATGAANGRRSVQSGFTATTDTSSGSGFSRRSPSTLNREFENPPEEEPESWVPLHLPALRVLDISGNGLSNVPGWLPAGLAVLQLDHNSISNLPPWLFEKLPDLKMLSMHHNRLTELPEEFTRLTALRAAALRYNPATDPDRLLAGGAPGGVAHTLTQWLYRRQLDLEQVSFSSACAAILF